MYLVLEVIQNINCKTTAFITTFEKLLHELLPDHVVDVNSLKQF